MRSMSSCSIPQAMIATSSCANRQQLDLILPPRTQIRRHHDAAHHVAADGLRHALIAGQSTLLCSASSASRQNLERGGVSEQGLIGAGNRWLTGPRRPKPPNHRPSWAPQYRSVEELPLLLPPYSTGRNTEGTPKKNRALYLDSSLQHGDGEYIGVE